MIAILTDILGEHRSEFWMNLLVALVCGVCVAAATTYMQQHRIVQTQKQQQERIESLTEQQEIQRRALQSIREDTRGMSVKLDLLLQAQGIEQGIPTSSPSQYIDPDTSEVQ